MKNNKINILIVEDERITAIDIKKHLETNENIAAHIAGTGIDAVMLAEQIKPDLIIMDIMLKGQLNGIDVADIIAKKNETPVIYLTAFTDDETFLNAQLTKPFAFLGKPFHEEELKNTIAGALKKYKIHSHLNV
jgi:two-component system, response regulator PdtaR